MRHHLARPAIALLLVTPLLAGCLERGQSTMSGTLAQDDDTYCRADGTVMPGSPQYTSCRKDRDAQRSQAEARADRRQRDLGEYMLNHPDRM